MLVTKTHGTFVVLQLDMLNIIFMHNKYCYVCPASIHYVLIVVKCKHCVNLASSGRPKIPNYFRIKLIRREIRVITHFITVTHFILGCAENNFINVDIPFLLMPHAPLMPPPPSYFI